MKEKLHNIRLLLLDVDGVLTDGSITYTDAGEQIKSFNSKDGLGLRLLMDSGVSVGIVTGRTSGALLHRCKNLGIDLIFDGIKDKAAAFEDIVRKTGIPGSRIGFVGDDLMDLPAMVRAGISFTVADAPEEVREHADITTDLPGGHGAVRQVCEIILKSCGKWDNIVAGFLS
ncbi:MAG: HAD hydrolase family protein [Desulfobacterales bacterium]|nr:HAD hydrolase family protein [Desulfobacterales bacterium]